MFIDTITLAEGSVLENLTVARGIAFPDFPSTGELFFRSDIDGGALFVYVGGTWYKSANTANITPADIGLDNVNNTTDLLKPISNATQSALDLKVDTSALSAVATSGEYSDIANTPTLASLGLDQVDNTPDINKPISSLTQNAINLKANTSALSAVAFSGEYSDVANTPTLPTITSLGLNNVNNTSDANKPISNATQSALDLKANTSALSVVATSGNYSDILNPPALPTLASLGLTNVNNTSDANKPVSIAMQTALNGKIDLSTNNFVQIPAVVSSPVAAPTDIQSGFVPMVYDTANNRLWIYNGSWRSSTFV